MKDTVETHAAEGVFPSDHEVPQHFIELRAAQGPVLLNWLVCGDFFFLPHWCHDVINFWYNRHLLGYVGESQLLSKLKKPLQSSLVFP